MDGIDGKFGANARARSGARLPIEVVDLVTRLQSRFGRTVTVQAKLHRERFDCVDLRHGVDPPVTNHAAHPASHVTGVIEEHEMRKPRDAFPGQRAAVEIGSAHGLEFRTFSPNLVVTAHAQRNRGHTGQRRAHGVTMAIQARNAVVADVMTMVELHWLLFRIFSTRDVWGAFPRPKRYRNREYTQSHQTQYDAKCAGGPLGKQR